MKRICAREQRISRYVSFGCFRRFRKRRKRSCLENSYCDREPQSELIIAKHTGGGAKRNLSLNAVIPCARLKKRPIGLNSLSERESSPRRSCSLFRTNATSSPRFS